MGTRTDLTIQIKSTNLVCEAKCLKHYLLGKNVIATDLLALFIVKQAGPYLARLEVDMNIS